VFRPTNVTGPCTNQATTKANHRMPTSRKRPRRTDDEPQAEAQAEAKAQAEAQGRALGKWQIPAAVMMIYGRLILKWALQYVCDPGAVVSVAFSCKEMLEHVNANMTTESVVRVAYRKKATDLLQRQVHALSLVKKLYPPPACGTHVHFLITTAQKLCGFCGKGNVRVPYGGNHLGLPALMHAKCAYYCHPGTWTPVTTLTVKEVDTLIRRGVPCVKPLVHPEYGGFLTVPVGSMSPLLSVRGLAYPDAGGDSVALADQRARAYRSAYQWAREASAALAKQRQQHVEECMRLDRHVARSTLALGTVDALLAECDACEWDVHPTLRCFYEAKLERGRWTGDKYPLVYHVLMETMQSLAAVRPWTAQLHVVLAARNLPSLRELLTEPRYHPVLVDMARRLDPTRPPDGQPPITHSGKLENRFHKNLLASPVLDFVDVVEEVLAPEQAYARYPGKREEAKRTREQECMAREEKLSIAMEKHRRAAIWQAKSHGLLVAKLAKLRSSRPGWCDTDPATLERLMREEHMCLGCGSPAALTCTSSRCGACCCDLACKRHAAAQSARS
jgi:hypothetical protein